MIGTKLGPYEITAKLGEGGMGEVYRATDTKLHRDVAIKVLPAAFTQDPERLARFEREAQLLAQLQHPNIASIYGLEESGITRALVMELVEGPTLADRLEQGSLSVEESLSVARQVAEALEEAHEKGIVHRDLKPQNIKASLEGRVKVLDFGLAKAMEPAGATPGFGSASALANSPTLTQGATVEGMILGTAAYMSPEQAKGRPVDKRADIWAFGVVLFEMLTGRKLFDAETLAETLGAIFRQEIDLETLPAGASPRLRRLLERCLERDPRKRLRDIGEARVALDALVGGGAEPIAAADADRRRGVSLPVLGGLLAGAALIGALVVWSSMRVPPGDEAPPEVTEFSIAVEDLRYVRLSPDGRRLLWINGRTGDSERSLWVRSLDSRVPRKVASDADLGQAFWSPDGSALAVGVGEQLWRYPVAGGERVLICDFPRTEGVPRAFAISGAWLDDDTIVFGLWRGGVYRVPARGGVPEVAAPFDPDADVDIHLIFGLPDGESLLLEVHRQRAEDSTDPMENFRLELVRDGRRTPVEGGEALAGVDLLDFARGVLMVVPPDAGAKSVWGVPFDAGRGTVEAKRFVVLATPVDDFSAAADGTFGYVPRQAVPAIVARVDRSGVEVGRLGGVHSDVGEPALSPDGSRLALTLKGRELWVEDLVRGTLTRLIEEGDRIFDLQWTADGRTLYYNVSSQARSLRRIRADPGAVPETVLDGVYSTSVSPDGSGILFQKASYSLKTGQGLYWVALDATGPVGEPQKVADGIGTSGRLAPDGRMLAYNSVVAQRREIFLTTFPSRQQTLQLSSNGGSAPQWSPDGRSVFYASGSELIQVDVGLDGGGALTASPERKLFDAAEAGLQLDGWTVAPHGAGFLFLKPLEAERPPEIVVVRNGLQRAIAESR